VKLKVNILTLAAGNTAAAVPISACKESGVDRPVPTARTACLGRFRKNRNG